MGNATAAKHRGPSGGFFNVNAQSSARMRAVSWTHGGLGSATDKELTFYAYDVATPQWPAEQQ